MGTDALHRINHVMVIARDAVPGSGEDAYGYAVAQRAGMIGVFDGCGGMGARRYARYENHTGAYLASRALALEAMDWFDSAEDVPVEPALADDLSDRFRARLSSLRAGADEGRTILGSMVRAFPSTACVARFDFAGEGELRALFAWAGDSRGYALTPGGLVQWTKDDLTADFDAFDNLYEDAPLSNVVCADAPFRLNRRLVRLPYPAILLVATDGAFGYLPSPMHLEQLILETLCAADSLDAWRAALSERILAVASDDVALLAAVFGWQSFGELRLSFARRRAELSQYGLAARADAEKERLRALWESYKRGYYPRENAHE